ncbi:hypothetical protein BJ875DRAFT_524290 [Amylocarpus encephaloides]|uniref:Uncharacterized protein n=1 Tax=Amylocarpus encephaloides TaxID=45428 RepID=A0A9P8C7T9_9HELO|nr:hypothetical protein BJ875DRAFT_524290 [Amylocarpus encephaloides]
MPEPSLVDFDGGSESCYEDYEQEVNTKEEERVSGHPVMAAVEYQDLIGVMNVHAPNNDKNNTPMSDNSDASREVTIRGGGSLSEQEDKFVIGEEETANNQDDFYLDAGIVMNASPSTVYVGSILDTPPLDINLSLPLRPEGTSYDARLSIIPAPRRYVGPPLGLRDHICEAPRDKRSDGLDFPTFLQSVLVPELDDKLFQESLPDTPPLSPSPFSLASPDHTSLSLLSLAFPDLDVDPLIISLSQAQSLPCNDALRNKEDKFAVVRGCYRFALPDTNHFYRVRCRCEKCTGWRSVHMVGNGNIAALEPGDFKAKVSESEFADADELVATTGDVESDGELDRMISDLMDGDEDEDRDRELSDEEWIAEWSARLDHLVALEDAAKSRGEVEGSPEATPVWGTPVEGMPTGCSLPLSVFVKGLRVESSSVDSTSVDNTSVDTMPSDSKSTDPIFAPVVLEPMRLQSIELQSMNYQPAGKVSNEDHSVAQVKMKGWMNWCCFSRCH